MRSHWKLSSSLALALVTVSTMASPLTGAQVDLHLSDLEAISAAAPRVTLTVHLSPGRLPSLRGIDEPSSIRARVRATAHPPDALLVLEVPEVQEVMVDLAGSGESKIVVMDFSTREEWARVTVQLDPLQEIDERDEGNNYGEAFFGTPMADGAPEAPIPPAEGMRGPPRPPDFAKGLPSRAGQPVAVEDGAPVEVAPDLMITVEGPDQLDILTRQSFLWYVQLLGKLPIGTEFYIHINPNLILEAFESDFASCQETSPGPDTPLNQDGTYVLCDYTGSDREVWISTRPRWSDEEIYGIPRGSWLRKPGIVSAGVDWANQIIEQEEGNNEDWDLVNLWLCTHPGDC